MQLRSIFYLLLVLLIPLVLASCDDKKAPEEKESDSELESKEPQTKKPTKRVMLYGKSKKADTEDEVSVVFVPSGTTGTQTIAIGSVSFYDWMNDIRKTLAKEKRENINDACIKLLNAGSTDPKALDIDYEVDLTCATAPEGEASHTDPSPLDDTDQWILCQARQSEPGSGAPGGDPSGGTPGSDPGSGPSDPGAAPGGDGGGDSGGDEGTGSETVDSMVEILCTPAIGPQPGVDPRLVYPAPDQVDAVVANISPCVKDFCPFEIAFNPPEPIDPTDPIDPSQDEPEELTERFRDQLKCDQFKGLCDPDISLIDKNDLVKDDSDGTEDLEEAKDGSCDGTDNKKPGETCKEGNVGTDEAWTVCISSTASEATVCVEHDPKSSEEYRVRWVNHEGSEHSDAWPDDRDHEATQIVNSLHHDDNQECTIRGVGQGSDGSRTGASLACQ